MIHRLLSRLAKVVGLWECVALGGGACVVFAISWLYWPAGLIVAGLLLILLALAGAKGGL